MADFSFLYDIFPEEAFPEEQWPSFSATVFTGFAKWTVAASQPEVVVLAVQPSVTMAASQPSIAMTAEV